MKETFPDVIDLLRGDAALLEAAKKGNLAKVRINFHLFPVLFFDSPENIRKPKVSDVLEREREVKE